MLMLIRLCHAPIVLEYMYSEYYGTSTVLYALGIEILKDPKLSLAKRGCYANSMEVKFVPCIQHYGHDTCKLVFDQCFDRLYFACMDRIL